MKKIITIIITLAFIGHLKSQNPWIKCNAVEVLTQRLPKTMPNIGANNLGNDTTMGYTNGNFTDTCMVLKMNSKCAGLDSSEGVFNVF